MFPNLQKLKWVDGLLILGLGMIALGLGMSIREKTVKENKVELIKGGQVMMVGETRVVTVDIEGAVINPGIYKLADGSRVNEVLVMAGGLAVDADRDWVEKNINKAEVLEDGVKIIIPKKNNQFPISKSQIISNEIININTAGVEELDTLTGIGPAMANRIIDYRQKNSGFRNIEEIKLVSGIGEVLFEKIKDKISL